MSDRIDITFDTKVVTKADEACEQPTSARPIEVLAGAARRRDWSDDDKARIIVESLAPGSNISAVARRHGIKPQQLFGWRRAARELFQGQAPTTALPAGRPARPVLPAEAEPPVPTFAPVLIARPSEPAQATPPTLPAPSPPVPVEDHGGSGVIEIAVGGSIVRVGRGADAGMLAMVLAAVRRASS